MHHHCTLCSSGCNCTNTTFFCERGLLTRTNCLKPKLITAKLSLSGNNIYCKVTTAERLAASQSLWQRLFQIAVSKANGQKSVLHMAAGGTDLSADLGSAQRLQVSAPSGSHTPGKCLMLFRVATKESYQSEQAFWMPFLSLTLIASVRRAPAPSCEEAGRLKAACKGAPNAAVRGELWPVLPWSCRSKLPTREITWLSWKGAHCSRFEQWAASPPASHWPLANAITVGRVYCALHSASPRKCI